MTLNPSNFGQFASSPTGKAVSPSEVGRDFDVKKVYCSNTYSWKEAWGADPNRFAIIVPSFTSSSQFRLTWDTNNTAAQPMIGQLGTPIQSLNYRDFGPLITQPMFYQFSSSGGTYLFYLISYRPRR